MTDKDEVNTGVENRNDIMKESSKSTKDRNRERLENPVATCVHHTPPCRMESLSSYGN